MADDFVNRVSAALEGQLRLWAGLAASVSAALLAQSDLIPDGKWRHSLAIAGIVGTAVNGYFLQHPPKETE